MGAGAFENPGETWDGKYDTDAYIFGTQPNQFLLAQRDRFHAGDRVLAVADGEGRNGVWLAGLGCAVLSMDISPRAIAKARHLALQHGVALEFEVADLMHWQWPQGSFDTVVCIFIQFAAPSERDVLFQGFWQALRPGGMLLMQGFGTDQLKYSSGGPGRIEHLYSQDMLREAFAKWDILLLKEYEAILDEGPKHQGMAALVDLVARKPFGV